MSHLFDTSLLRGNFKRKEELLASNHKNTIQFHQKLHRADCNVASAIDVDRFLTFFTCKYRLTAIRSV